MTKAGLDSSISSPFLLEPELDHPNAVPPPEGAYLDPNSDEYIQQLSAALELNDPRYSHVDPSTMSAFKQILCKYPTAFDLPDAPLGTIKAFITTLKQVIPHQFTSYHTGNAQLSYVLSRMSYSKCCL